MAVANETKAREIQRRINLFSKVNRTAVSLHNANPKLRKMTPIDWNDNEVQAFLKSLYDNDVQYLLVGGFAMAFHGYVRATQDLDLWIKDDEFNLERLRKVLKEHGVAGIDQMRSMDLVPGFTQFAIGESGFVIDPMKNLKAFSAYDFDACYQRAEQGEYNGVKFKVIHAQDFLKEKQATNRPKDQGDIEFLKSLDS
ncbi:MAG: nucleotidyltransferase [Bacteroidota bacterium]